MSTAHQAKGHPTRFDLTQNAGRQVGKPDDHYTAFTCGITF